MRPRLWHLVLVIVAVVACDFAFQRGRRLEPAYANLPDKIEGTFPRDGEHREQPLAESNALRHWGSFAGSDRNLGTLHLGPFAAPGRIRLGVSGYPTKPGNRIYLERADTHEQLPIVVGDVGSSWRIVDVDVSPSWIGQPVLLTAVDGSSDWLGWLAITEPLQGGIGEGNTALYQSLTGWLLNGLLLGVVWIAAIMAIGTPKTIDPAWVPLLAAGIVASAGYILFWLYFATPVVGKIASVTLILASAVVAFRRRKRLPAAPAAEARICALLLVAVGAFYVALLHLYPSSRDFYEIAANRLREQMPADNALPHDVALALYDGRTLRAEGADWLTSDRPPLQAAWQLLTLPVLSVLKLDRAAVTGTAALWLQLLWIPAGYGLLRTLGLRPGRAAAWLIAMGITGFFAQNTLFTWPKLSAAAFGIGAFALWILPARGNHAYAIGAMFAALGWLSHGGIAFSYLALLPWIFRQMIRGEIRGWILAFAVFLAFALPWFAFQKFYNPPGDRLIKMHLAGQPAKDARPAWTVIRSAYAAKSAAEIVDNKAWNVRLLAMGTWPAMFDFSTAMRGVRRNDEFFCVFRALTWWLAAVVAFPFALLVPRVRHRLAATAPALRALAAWTALTLAIWCGLMFGPHTTSIHQGSYAVMLVLFCLLSAVLEQIDRRWIFPVVALQVATFVSTWVGANDQVNGPPTGWPFVLAATAGLLTLFVGTLRHESPAAHP